MLLNSQVLVRSLLAVCVVLIGANLKDAHGQQLSDYPSISAGSGHSLALQEDGSVRAWGDISFGQCDVPPNLKAVAISAGVYHSLALKEDGSVVAWGSPADGRLDVPSNLKAVAISAGGHHSLALKEDGSVVAWGDNSYGQCKVPRKLKAVAISARGSHSLALKEDGSVIAWGSNTFYQCDVPRKLRVASVSAGGYHSLALKEKGRVVAWGNNNEGQCDVPRGLRAVAVSAGVYHSLAIEEDGSVVAWGGNGSGQCDVPSNLKAIAIDAGFHHSLALIEDGSVVAWGKLIQDVPSDLVAQISNASSLLNSDPPMLNLTPGSISIPGVNSLSGMDEVVVRFELTNSAGGTATGLKAQVQVEGQTAGVSIPASVDLPSIPVGESRVCEIPISTNRSTKDGSVKITVEVIEPKGFSPPPFALDVAIRKFNAPNVQVADFSSSSPQWKPLAATTLDVLVQNLGSDASAVVVELQLPNGVACLSNNNRTVIGDLARGDMETVQYDLLIPRNFNLTEVKPVVTITEEYGDYGSTWSHAFPFENAQAVQTVVISGPEGTDDNEVVKGSLGNTASSGGDVLFNTTNAAHVIQAIAVIPKDGENCFGTAKGGDDLATYGEAALLGTYNVVDRRFVEETLNEIKLGMTGLTFEDGVLEAGCIENAQGYLFVEHGCLQNKETIKAKLIHCESSEIVWNCIGQGSSPQETFEHIVSELNGN